MGQDKNIPRQGSGMKDNMIMQTPEKGMGNSAGKMGKNDLMGAGGPSPTGEKLQQILSGNARANPGYGDNWS